MYIFINVYILQLAKIKYGSYVNALTVFLLFVLFFNGTRIVLDLFGYDDMRYLYFVSTQTISEESNNQAILNINIGIISLALGYFLYKKKCVSHGDIVLPDRLLYVLFLIGFVAKVYVTYLSFSFITLFSYAEVFTTGISIPTYLSVLSYLPVFVCLYKFRQGAGGFWIIAMICYGLLSMATGQRGPGMILIVMTLYYCVKLGLLKVNFIKIFFFGIVTTILLIAVGISRKGNDVDLESIQFMDFFWGQSVSIDVLQLSIQDYYELDYNFFDLFGNIYYFIDRAIIHRGAHPDFMNEMASQHKMWSSYITYIENPKMYFEGFGLGGNFFAQAFAVGREFGVVLICFFVGFFIHVLERILLSGKILSVFIVFTVFQSIIYIPRDNLFDFVTDMRLPLYFVIIMSFSLIWFKSSNLSKLY